MSNYPISDDERDARAEDFEARRKMSEAWHAWRDRIAELESALAAERARADTLAQVAATLAKLARHTDDCWHWKTLPTGFPNQWHCTCGLDSLVLDGELIDAALADWRTARGAK